MIDQRDANPWRVDTSRKAEGSIHGAGKGFFCHKITINEYLYHHLVVEYVHYIIVDCTYKALIVSCVHVADEFEYGSFYNIAGSV